MIDVTSFYSIALYPNDSEKTPYFSSMAWIKIHDETSLQIKICNKAKSSSWQTIIYRLLGEDLQWNNGKRDFIFEKVAKQALPCNARISLDKWDDYFKNTYGVGSEFEL